MCVWTCARALTHSLDTGEQDNEIKPAAAAAGLRPGDPESPRCGAAAVHAHGIAAKAHRSSPLPIATLIARTITWIIGRALA